MRIDLHTPVSRGKQRKSKQPLPRTPWSCASICCSPCDFKSPARCMTGTSPEAPAALYQICMSCYPGLSSDRADCTYNKLNSFLFTELQRPFPTKVGNPSVFSPPGLAMVSAGKILPQWQSKALGTVQPQKGNKRSMGGRWPPLASIAVRTGPLLKA